MNQKDKFTIVRDDDEDGREGLSFGRKVRPPSGPLSVFRGAAGIRLLFMCLLLVGVVWAMNYSGRPESWNWLFRFDQVDISDPSANDDSGQMNSRGFLNADLSAGEGERKSKSEKDGDAESRSGNGDERTGEDPLESAGANNDFAPVVHRSVDQAETWFWKQSLERLDGDEQVRLFNLINCAASQKPLPVGATVMSIQVFSKVNRWHQSFARTLAASDFPLPGFEESWKQSIEPAMQAILDDKVDSSLLDDKLRTLPDMVESAANLLIEDKTSVGRTRESYAWFAAWNRVFDLPIDTSTENPATVTQVLSQPDYWRGQVISISGTAMRAEKIDASYNTLGIDRYYVIWIKPDHPSSYPWCVYTLMAPDSLVGESSEGVQAVNVRVVTNARFFKNRLFNAGQAAFAPLLMTASVTEPQSELLNEAKKPFQMPGWKLILLTVGIVGVMASMIAWTAWRTTLSGRTRALPGSERLEQRFNLLQDDERIETTTERLKRMSETVDDAQDRHLD